MNDLNFADTDNNGRLDDPYDSDGDSINGNWTAIGNGSNPFMGTFDGNGHIITGMNINLLVVDTQGLFGYISGTSSAIKNVGVVDVSIKVKGYCAGGVVGINSEGKVENCYVTGNVSGYHGTGGVIGGLRNSGTVRL